MLVCLMPLSWYKKKDLYKHVETFDLADPSLFKDAVITENLCICTLKKDIADKYSWMDLVLKSVDQRYIEFYKWNIEHNKSITWKSANYKPIEFFNKDLDFVDTTRCTYYNCTGGSFGPNSIGYKWNKLKNYSSINSDIGYIRLKSSKAKENFTKYVYSWKDPKLRAYTLNNKVVWGSHATHATGENYFIWPQIDWENIHINQKELWDKGDYDNAVLSEMGLKWNADKTVIIKDE